MAPELVTLTLPALCPVPAPPPVLFDAASVPTESEPLTAKPPLPPPPPIDCATMPWDNSPPVMI